MEKLEAEEDRKGREEVVSQKLSKLCREEQD
jgi:hypothetical protein